MKSKLPCPEGSELQVVSRSLVCRAKAAKTTSVLGAKQGPSITFDANGKKRAEGSYANDERDGPWWAWDEIGNVTGYTEFKRGQEDGLVVQLHSTGKRDIEQRLKAGKLEGTCKRWSSAGKLEAITQWTDGEVVNVQVFSPNPEAKPGELKMLEASHQRASQMQREMLRKF
jgi:antitoxin component YwqK of YwqJK toxin-antitoxin module